jgi:hypothetical protein
MVVAFPLTRRIYQADMTSGNVLCAKIHNTTSCASNTKALGVAVAALPSRPRTAMDTYLLAILG